MDELPLPILSNEDAGPAMLLIYRTVFILSFGGGAMVRIAVSP
jgi:hypothetical protein